MIRIPLPYRSLRQHWSLLTGGILLGVLLSAPRSLHAQDLPQEAPTIQVVTIAVSGVPLHQALDLLGRESHEPIFFESSLVADKRATCVVKSVPIPQALSCILRGTGLDWIQLSRGTFVVVASRDETPVGNISGWILDASTGQGVPHAVVRISGHTTRVSTSEGFFNVADVPVGPTDLVVSHLGFRSDSLRIIVQPFESKHVRIPLQERILTTGTVVVNGLSSSLPQAEPGTASLDGGHIRTHPASAWSMTDPITQIPGTAASPALGDLHLQGSSSGSHEFRLDAAPVYMPIKNGAFISPFSALAIDRITLYKAGFPAKVGSQLAGFVEMDQVSGNDSIDPVTIQMDRLALNARLGERWHFPGGRSLGAMLAGRKSIGTSWRPSPLEDRFASWSRPDVFLSEQLGLLDADATDPFGPVEVDFTDIHARFDLQWDTLRRLTLSTYYGFNVFGSDLFEHVGGEEARSRDEYQWKNRVTTLRYSWVTSGGHFVAIDAWKSDYRLEHPFVRNPFQQNPDEPASREFNEIDQTGIRVSLDRAIGLHSFVSFDAGAREADSDFRVSSRPFLEKPDLTVTSLLPSRWLLDGSIDWRRDFGSTRSLTVGSRVGYIPSHGRPYFEPRVTWRHAPERFEALGGAYRLSAGVYRQFTTQLDLAPFTESALLPGFRLWIPIGRDNLPAWALHSSSDVVLHPFSRTKISIEVFAKYAPRTWILDYSRTAMAPITSVSTSAAGGSIDIRWKGDRFEGGGSYAFEHSEFKQTNRFDGRWMTNPWSMPHRVQLSGTLNLGNHLTMDISSTSVLGRTWGYRMSYYNYLPLIAPSAEISSLGLDAPDEHRPGAFHRVDIGLGADLPLPRVDLSVHASILNIFDTANVVDWMLPGSTSDGQAPGNDQRVDRLAMPRLALLSIMASF